MGTPKQVTRRIFSENSRNTTIGFLMLPLYSYYVLGVLSNFLLRTAWELGVLGSFVLGFRVYAVALRRDVATHKTQFRRPASRLANELWYGLGIDAPGMGFSRRQTLLCFGHGCRWNGVLVPCYGWYKR